MQKSTLPEKTPEPAGNDNGRSQKTGVPPSENEEGVKPLIPLISGFQALPDNNTAIPPDTMGAVGPNHLMTMLNTEVRIQNRTGANLGTVSLATWWTSGTGLSGIPFDPRIIYDALSNRWMATVDANPKNLTTSKIWLAVSSTSDPTGAWSYYSFNQESPTTNALWHDFPDIGVNKHWVAISNNMFDGGGNFKGIGLTAIDKSALLGGMSISTWTWPQGYDNWGAGGGSTLRPAVTFDAAENVLYMVDGNRWAIGSPRTGLIRLSRITGTPSTSPTWSIVPDAGGFSPGSGWFLSPEAYDPWYQRNASQPGTSARVSTNNPRIQNAVFRDGRLWFTHSGGRPHNDSTTKDRTVVSWYQVNPVLLNTTGVPTIQSGTLDPGADGHFFFPSIAVNGSNDAALGFSHSNSTKYVRGVATGRKSSDPAGSMNPITVIKAGEDSYEKVGSGALVRWGDYSATVVDPADDKTFWTLQEYAAKDVGPTANDDRWGTWWAHIGTAAGVTGGCYFIPLEEKYFPTCL